MSEMEPRLKQQIPIVDFVDFTVFGFDEGSGAEIIVNTTYDALRMWRKAAGVYLQEMKRSVEEADTTISDLALRALREERGRLLPYMAPKMILKGGGVEKEFIFDGTPEPVEEVDAIFNELIPLCVDEIIERKAYRALNGGASFRRSRRERDDRAKA